MGLLTFSLDVTLDGCNDHREMIADDERHDYFTELMDAGGAMLFGRTTYERLRSSRRVWLARPEPCHGFRDVVQDQVRSSRAALSAALEPRAHACIAEAQQARS